jgi:hypothetical protein
MIACTPVANPNVNSGSVWNSLNLLSKHAKHCVHAVTLSCLTRCGECHFLLMRIDRATSLGTPSADMVSTTRL